MLKMILFPFKVALFLPCLLFGYNLFKRERKGDLPNKIYTVRFSLSLGYGDNKALCKGIEKAFGLDVYEILREVNGVDISKKFCGGSNDMWDHMTSPQGIIEWCQAEPETLHDEEFSWAEPRAPSVCVDGETLARLEASKAIVVYNRDDITSRVYKLYRNLARKDYLLEATRNMIKEDECSAECDECDTSYYAEGLNMDGECPNCGCYELPKEDLEAYIDRAEKEAA